MTRVRVLVRKFHHARPYCGKTRSLDRVWQDSRRAHATRAYVLDMCNPLGRRLPSPKHLPSSRVDWGGHSSMRSGPHGVRPRRAERPYNARARASRQIPWAGHLRCNLAGRAPSCTVLIGINGLACRAFSSTSRCAGDMARRGFAPQGGSQVCRRWQAALTQASCTRRPLASRPMSPCQKTPPSSASRDRFIGGASVHIAHSAAPSKYRSPRLPRMIAFSALRETLSLCSANR